MNEYEFKQVDFENPSALFFLEDILKGLIGGPLLYGPYYRTFELKGDEKVLDFGCGGGAGSRCLAQLLNRNGHLTCIDVSNHWINKARKRLIKYVNVRCIAGDIRALDIPADSFDVISTFHVIHDIAPIHRQDTVAALARLLRKDGTAFVREPIKKSHGIPVGEIQTLFSNAGLKEIEHLESKSEYKGRFQVAPDAKS
jgi:ubiquinone/menaquinone biosynthesis C-methylase UbiE